MSGLRDLSALGRGFGTPPLASQAVFRRALEALSRPGRIVKIDCDAETPAGLDAASCALALALLDQDTTLWCSPSVGRLRIGGYLRFHTGCTLVERCEDAQFVLAAGPELPALERLAAGSEDYPDRSATVIVQVDALREGGLWRLCGPGIRDTASIGCAGLPAAFTAQWQRNAALYPRGVDLFLACGSLVCGLPRTTRLEA